MKTKALLGEESESDGGNRAAYGTNQSPERRQEIDLAPPHTFISKVIQFGFVGALWAFVIN